MWKIPGNLFVSLGKSARFTQRLYARLFSCIISVAPSVSNISLPERNLFSSRFAEHLDGQTVCRLPDVWWERTCLSSSFFRAVHQQWQQSGVGDGRPFVVFIPLGWWIWLGEKLWSLLLLLLLPGGLKSQKLKRFWLLFRAVGSSHSSSYTPILMSLALISPSIHLFFLKFLSLLFYSSSLSFSFLYIYSSCPLFFFTFSSFLTSSFQSLVLSYAALISLQSCLLFLSSFLFLLLCCVTRRRKGNRIRTDFSVLQLWQQLCFSSVTATHTRTVTPMHQNLTFPSANQIESQSRVVQGWRV